MSNICENFFWAMFIIGLCYGAAYFNFMFLHIWGWFRPPYSLGFMAFIIYLIATVDNMDFPALPFIFLYMSGLYYYDDISYLQLAQNQWLNGLLVAGGYVLIGVIWSIFRLNIYLRNKNIRSDLKNTFQRIQSPSAPPRRSSRSVDNPSPTQPTTLVVDDNLLNAEAQRFLSQNKMRIYTWIVYWPFSLVHTFTHDLAQEILNLIYGRVLKKMFLYFVKNAILNAAKED